MSRLNDADLLVAQIFDIWLQLDDYFSTREFLEFVDIPTARLAYNSLMLSGELYRKYGRMVNDKKLSFHLREFSVVARKLDDMVSYNFEHPKFSR